MYGESSTSLTYNVLDNYLTFRKVIFKVKVAPQMGLAD